jgi:radical SAM superfamily enzyme YgiQ (UPF0313 family)
MNVLLIEDDHFLAKKERAIQILTGLKEYKDLRVEFPNGIAAFGITEYIGKLLKEAGATTISLAVESGSDFVLREVINKPLTVEVISKAADILKNVGITTHAFIVIGIPGEKFEHRIETVDMLKRIGFDWVYIFIAIPVAGSRLYDICVENGYLVSDDFSRHLASKGNIKAPEIDPVEIEKEAYEMNLNINFVNKFNLKNGRYNKANEYFIKIAEKYPDHAFAHFYASKAFKGLNLQEKEKYHREKFQSIISEDSDWNNYSKKLKIV